MQRPFMKMLPSTVSTNTKALSRVVCEDVWNHTKTIGLLALLPGVGDHEREQLEACIGDFIITNRREAVSDSTVCVQYHNYPRDYSHMFQRNTVRYDVGLGTVPYRAIFCHILRQGIVPDTIVWGY